MRAGEAVSESAERPGVTPADVLKQLSQLVCADSAYRATGGGTNTVQLVRIIRPRWAVVAGSIGTLFFGAGLLLFLVKLTESCTISAQDGPTGTVVTVSGQLTRARCTAVRAFLAGTAPTEEPLQDGSALPVAQPSAAFDGSGLHPSHSAGGWTFPAEDPLVDAGRPAVAVSSLESIAAGNQAETAVRTVIGASGSRPPGVCEPGGPTPTARFDDGTVVPVTGLTLIGRLPEGLPHENEAVLVSLLDSTMTVSKTHLSIRPAPGGAEVADRASANGTTVTDHSGREARLVVGRPVHVPFGSRVCLGDRMFDLVEG